MKYKFICVLILLKFNGFHLNPNPNSNDVTIDCSSFHQSQQLSCDNLKKLNTNCQFPLEIMLKQDKMVFRDPNSNVTLLSCTKDNVANLVAVEFGPDQLKNASQVIEMFGSSVQNLTLTKNFLGELKPNTFNKLTGLRKIILRQTNLSNFDFNPFEKLIDLQWLDISYNYLTKLNIDALKPTLGKIKHFYAAENHLENVHTLIQCLGSSVEYLMLSQIGHVDRITFKQLTHLKSVGLHHTNLENATEMIQSLSGSLQVINLSKSVVGRIGDEMFKNLTNLEFIALNSANLTDFNMNPFKHLKKLNELQIQNNNLERADFTLPPGVTSNLKELRVNGNNLTDLVGLTKISYPVLSSVNIIGNQFTCKLIRKLQKDFENLETESFECAGGNAEHGSPIASCVLSAIIILIAFV